MEIIKIENLSFAYNNSDYNILEDINLSVNEGEFLILYGPSGCGKTTLLKLMKKEIIPKGKIKGNIYYKGEKISELNPRQSAAEIGYVMQNPESQIVTDKVWHELAFGLENLGESSNVIRRKTAEISSLFGINKWFRDETNKLSGGQKQLLNLASVMIMSPELLLLDEPVSQLDPFSASSFTDMILRLNREFGITVIIAEHNLESIYSLADKIAVIDKNKIRYLGIPRTCCGFFSKNTQIIEGLPIPARIYHEFGIKASCPVDVKEAKDFIQNYCSNNIRKIENESAENNNSCSIELSNIFFRYEKKSDDIISDLSLNVRKGEIYAIVGGNGSGKTTLLSIISGQNIPYSGKVLINGKKNSNFSYIAMLPQNPVILFTEETVIDDLMSYAIRCGVKKAIVLNVVNDICRRLNIVDVIKNHPYDLSGGEIQKAALAKIMIKNSDILLLDEPTKGIDAWSKKEFISLLRKLSNDGKTVILVTHDNEFAAEVSDKCGLLFDGTIISEESTREFYSRNNFYTTSVSRITKGYFDNAITLEDIKYLRRKNGGIE